jgi:serine/threonine protein kinase/tetratricopeptide (TPR) repeat protein
LEPESGLVPGTIVDGLRIEFLVGTGGMGAVYKAVDLALDRPVAVKFLTAERNWKIAVERFRREATTVARCCHPGIVQVHSWGEHRGTPYFTMEFVDGAPLSAHIGKGRLFRSKSAEEIAELVAARYVHPDPEEPYFLRDPAGDPCRDPDHILESAALIASVADALAVAHAGGIVHRDIKPTNIMVNRQGATKIVDFGLAFSSAASDLTDSKQFLGTLRYMAPEQFERGRDRIGPWTDIYSLGVVLYELVTLVHPVEEGDVPAVIGQIVKGQPLPASSHNPRIPRRLSRIIERCLEKSPQNRFPSAEALADELRLASEGRTSGLRALAFLRHPGRISPPPSGAADPAAAGAAGARERSPGYGGAPGKIPPSPAAIAAKDAAGTAVAGGTAWTSGTTAAGRVTTGAGLPTAATKLLDLTYRTFRVSLNAAETLPLLQSVLDALPDCVPAHLLLFEVNEFLRDENACGGILNALEARTASFDDPGRMQAAAIGCLRRRDPGAALAAIRKHNRSFPFVPELTWPEIEARHAIGETARARGMVANLMRQRPDDALYRWYAARLYLLQERPQPAREALERSSEQAGLEWLHLPAAWLALDCGDLDGARRHVDRLHQTAGPHPGVLECKLRVALAEGNLEAAFRTARERVSLAEETLEKARAYSWLARLARMTGRTEEAARWEEIARRMGG